MSDGLSLGLFKAIATKTIPFLNYPLINLIKFSQNTQKYNSFAYKP